MEGESDDLKPVPDSLSFLYYVNEQWLAIERDAYQGLPYVHAIERVDNFIQAGVNDFNSGNLLSGYDWASDLTAALSTNRFKKSWLERTLVLRIEHVDWWRKYISETHRDLNVGAVEGRKLLLVSHGTAILGAMAALGTIENSPIQASFFAVAIGGLFAFITAGLGIIIWLEYYGSAINKIHNDFKSTHQMSRYAAYSRYLRIRYKKEVRWSIWLTYTSVAALPIYSKIAITLALNK